MAEDWAANVKKYVPDADDGIIAGIVRYCGIALQKRDSSLVSFGDPAETKRVRENFLKKKLALTQSDDLLDKAIATVGERMKGENFKNRVTVYYLLADHFGLLSLFAKAPSKKAASASGAAAATAAAGGAAALGLASLGGGKDDAGAAAAAPAEPGSSVGKAGAAVAGAAAAGLAGAGAVAAKAADTAGAVVSGTVDAAGKAGSAVVDAAGAAASGAADLASKAGNAAVDAAGTVVSGAADAADKAGAVVVGAAGAALGAAGALASGASDTASAAVGKLSSAASSVTGIGSDDGEESSGLGWLWWLLLAALAAALLWWLFGRGGSAEHTTAPADSASVAAAPTGSAADSTAGDVIASAPAEGTVQIPQGAGVTTEMRDGKPVVKVYFDTAKTDVAPAFGAAAGGLKAWLEKNAGSTLAVSGYNDKTGNAAANAELSKNRAQAVAAELAKAGIAEGSVALVKPEATTDTQVDNASARRVEVVVK